MFPFGVGALYNGQYTKALLHLVIFAGLVHMQDRGGGQPFIGLVLAGFIIYQFFDNIQSARAINAAAAGQVPATAVDQGLPEIPSQGSIFWGVVLIVLGGLLILANFEIINYDTLDRLLARRGHRPRAQARGRRGGQVQERQVTEVSHGQSERKATRSSGASS